MPVTDMRISMTRFLLISLASSVGALNLGDLLGSALGGKGKTFAPPVIMGDEEMMQQKAHGTSELPVQDNLRWSCREDIADRICNFNRHYAENGGYWERSTSFLKEESMTTGEITFYDSVTGEPLFYAPRGRSWESFVRESRIHGWPSFRDEETNWEHVRVLPNGECISKQGTHVRTRDSNPRPFVTSHVTCFASTLAARSQPTRRQRQPLLHQSRQRSGPARGTRRPLESQVKQTE